MLRLDLHRIGVGLEALRGCFNSMQQSPLMTAACWASAATLIATKVRWLFGQLERTSSGSLLIAAIVNTGKNLTIRPFEQPGDGLVCNAYARAADVIASAPKGEVFPRVKGKGGISVHTDVFGDVLLGTGEGSDAFILFSPDMFWQNGICANLGAPQAPGSKPSEVLFHEMVHAYRQMRGLSYTLPTLGGRARYDDLEEFAAVVLTNIYTSEVFGTTALLRADHHDFTKLDPKNTSDFLADPANRRLLDMLRKSDPAFFATFGKIKAAFNPLR